MTFPVLLDDQLVLCFKEISGEEENPITHASLKKPTRDSTIQIFRFAFETLGYNVDNACKIPEHVWLKIQHPELYHPDIVTLLRFCVFIQTFLRKIGYPDFGIEDLQDPKPKRLRRQLSALANYMLFREQQKNTYVLDVLDEREEAEQRRKQIEQENMEVKTELQNQLGEEERVKQLISAENEVIGQRQAEFAELSEQKEPLELEYKTLRADLGREEKQLQEITVQEAQLNEEKQQLQEQVVGSPDKVLQSLLNAEKELKTMESKREEEVEKQRQLGSRIQQVAQLHEGLDRLRQKLGVVSEDVSRLSDSKAKLAGRLEEVDALNQELEQAQATVRRLQSRIEMMEESREAQMMKDKRFLDSKTKQLEDRKVVLETVRAEMAKHEASVEALRAQVEQISSRRQENTALFKKNMAQKRREEQDIMMQVQEVRLENAKKLETMMDLFKSD